jgi:hypothetical protein
MDLTLSTDQYIEKIKSMSKQEQLELARDFRTPDVLLSALFEVGDDDIKKDIAIYQGTSKAFAEKHDILGYLPTGISGAF